jgi:DNA end-binding protein Ku
MPRAIWTGSVSFGLVSIPVRLLPAVRADEDVHFHYLHAKDGGRLHNVRRCEICGKDVPWDQTQRGFEWEKGRFVTLEDEERKALLPEASQTVEIQSFVARDEIDPKLFDTPYYLEPDKRGAHAYALLRDALEAADKVGIAQVVLRTRAHLAAVVPDGRGLVLELLHYAHEILPATRPTAQKARDAKARGAELKTARMLIDAMVRPFDPEEYRDDYEARLRQLLQAKARGKAPPTPSHQAPRATNVVDLADVLQRSLERQRTVKKASRGRATSSRRAARKAS